jgi:hypothetical protein
VCVRVWVCAIGWCVKCTQKKYAIKS